jgi:hypothetical protein
MPTPQPGLSPEILAQLARNTPITNYHPMRRGGNVHRKRMAMGSLTGQMNINGSPNQGNFGTPPGIGPNGQPMGGRNIDTAFGQGGFPAPGTPLFNQLNNPGQRPGPGGNNRGAGQNPMRQNPMGQNPIPQPGSSLGSGILGSIINAGGQPMPSNPINSNLVAGSQQIMPSGQPVSPMNSNPAAGGQPTNPLWGMRHGGKAMRRMADGGQLIDPYGGKRMTNMEMQMARRAAAANSNVPSSAPQPNPYPYTANDVMNNPYSRSGNNVKSVDALLNSPAFRRASKRFEDK